MKSLANLFALCLILGVAGGIYQLKMMVDARSRDVADLERQIQKDRDAIRVLRAEAAYLSSPPVVQKRARKFLTLREPRTKQVIRSLSDIPLRLDPKAPVDEAKTLIKPTVDPDDDRTPAPPPGAGGNNAVMGVSMQTDTGSGRRSRLGVTTAEYRESRP